MTLQQAIDTLGVLRALGLVFVVCIVLWCDAWDGLYAYECWQAWRRGR